VAGVVFRDLKPTDTTTMVAETSLVERGSRGALCVGWLQPGECAYLFSRFVVSWTFSANDLHLRLKALGMSLQRRCLEAGRSTTRTGTAA
jgi:hypothetical protein